MLWGYFAYEVAVEHVVGRIPGIVIIDGVAITKVDPRSNDGQKLVIRMPWQGQSLDRIIEDVRQDPGGCNVSFRLFYFLPLFKDLLETATIMVNGSMSGMSAMQADLKSANVLETTLFDPGSGFPYLKGQFCDIGGIW